MLFRSRVKDQPIHCLRLSILCGSSFEQRWAMTSIESRYPLRAVALLQKNYELCVRDIIGNNSSSLRLFPSPPLPSTFSFYYSKIRWILFPGIMGADVRWRPSVMVMVLLARARVSAAWPRMHYGVVVAVGRYRPRRIHRRSSGSVSLLPV